MGCLISFKWIGLFLGYNLAGGRGAIFGFLLGWLIDSMYSKPKIHFTFYQGEDYDRYQRRQQQQTYQPYVDVTLQEAYRTLNISETATDDEVRQAYRQMALKYHPDRVVSQGEEARQAAEKKFQQISEAKEVIFRARGM